MDLDHCSGLKELLESSGCAIVNIENIIIPDSEECRDEFDEIHSVCGIKLFLGWSTGNMFVDRLETLRKIFE